MKTLAFVTTVSLSLNCLVAPASIAASPAFDEGVKLYNSGKYSAALTQFARAQTDNPKDVLTHYYCGLCYRGINQMQKAQQEFTWVAYYGTGKVKSQANGALANMSRLSGQGVDSSRGGQTANTFHYDPATSKVQGALTITEFYTKWCGVCRKFEPKWKEAASRLNGTVTFRQLDAEAPSNASLVKQYDVRAFPTLIYTDSTGKLVKVRGAFPNVEAFMEDIKLTIGG